MIENHIINRIADVINYRAAFISILSKTFSVIEMESIFFG